MSRARRTVVWGSLFVLLLLLSAGMVTVPGGDDDVAVVRAFYEAHRTVVVVAQLVGLAAACAFLPFARNLQLQHWVGRAPWVLVAGVAVTVAAVLAAVPPLVLCVVVPDAGSDTISALAVASDLVDVVLFAAIAAFGVALAAAVATSWVRVLAVVVAVVGVARGILLLTGSDALELLAPLAFIVLVVCLAVVSWRSRGAR